MFGIFSDIDNKIIGSRQPIGFFWRALIQLHTGRVTEDGSLCGSHDEPEALDEPESACEWP